MKASNIIDRLIEEAGKLPQVLAPVWSDKQQKVIVMINGHPYRLTISPRVVGPGWYIIEPISSWEAHPIREAYPYEIMTFLKHLPRLMSISVRRFSRYSWLTYPFNMGDAKQRFRDFQFPKPAYMVKDNLEPFDVITCRVMGDTLLYESKAPIGALYHMREKLKEALANKKSEHNIARANPEFRMVYNILLEEVKRRELSTVEGKIRDSLEFLGAELVSYEDRGEDYLVRWKDDHGEVHEVIVSRDLRLISAGICLDGLENEQTLTSTVAVMKKYWERESW